MSTRATKAGALRWLADRVGVEVDTVQVRPSGITWEPGLRTVARAGAHAFTLDGSHVRLSPAHVVLEVTEHRVRIEWQDDDGVRIHVTEYRDPPTTDDDDTDD